MYFLHYKTLISSKLSFAGGENKKFQLVGLERSLIFTKSKKIILLTLQRSNFEHTGNDNILLYQWGYSWVQYHTICISRLEKM